MLMPVIRRRARPGRHDHRRHRLHLLGLHRLPGRHGLQLRADPRRRRALAADPGEPRRDGRRLGALRGLGQAPARRDRHRPGLLLRQVLARATCRWCSPASSTRTPSLRSGPTRQPGRAAGPGAARRGQGHRGGPGRGGGPQPQDAPWTTPTPSWPGTGRRPSCSRRPDLIAPLRKARLPADHRRRRRRGARGGRRRPRRWSDRPAWIRGIDHRVEPMALGLRDLTTSRVHPARRREGRAWRDGDRSTWPSCTRRSPTRS